MAISVPTGDGPFYHGLKAVVEWMKRVADERGFDKAFINNKLEPAFKEYEAAYLPCLDKEHRTKAMVAIKNEKKKQARPIYYEAVMQIKANQKTSDDERITLGIVPNAKTVHAKIPVTATSPVVEVNTSEPMRVVVTVKEKGKEKVGRPDGGRMWEARWVVSDEYTSDIERLTNFAVHSGYKVEMTFDQTQRGKILLLAVRWVSPSGEEGKWSVIVAVYIP